MGFEKYREHGMGHLYVLEKDSDAAGLLEALEDPFVSSSPRRACRAIMGLRRLRAFDAAPAVVSLLDSDQPTSVRICVAKALGPFGNPIALPALRRALRDSSPKVAIWAARSLGELQDRVSLESLIARLDDRNSAARAGAARAIGEIGDQQGTLPLIRQARRQEWNCAY